jgi:sorbin and SH3 domain-containing protein 1
MPFDGKNLLPYFPFSAQYTMIQSRAYTSSYCCIPFPDDTEIEYFPISPTLTRIRVHKPRHQVPSFLYYPVRAYTTPPVFSTFKRTARSAVSAPPPPQRRSSRHNTTLRLWSRITPPTPGEKVRFLRERLSCRLGARSPSGSPSRIPMGTTTRSSTVLLPRGKEDRALRLSVSLSPRGRELLNAPTTVTAVPVGSSPSRKEKEATRTTSPSPVRPPSASSLRHAECRKEDSKKVIKSSAPAPSSLARPKSVIQEEERRAKEARKKVKERVAKASGNGKSKSKIDEAKKAVKKVTDNSLAIEKRKRTTKEKKPVEKAIQKTEVRREPEVSRRDQFFQHLLLRDQPEVTLSRSSSVLERARRYTQARRTVVRPSLDSSLKIFLTQRRAVSQSPFRVLDVVLHRSLSQLPSLPPLPPINYKERSVSEPPMQRSLRDPGNLRPPRIPSPSPVRMTSPITRTPSPPSRGPSPVSSSPSARRLRARGTASPSPVRARSHSPLSTRNPEYLEYMLELKHSMPKCARFKELSRLYGSIERIGQLQRTAASCSDLRRSAGREPREANFDRWWRERTREKAEKELRILYGELRAAQKQRQFGFKLPTGPSWKPDSALRCRERSVEDLRAKFQEIADRNGQTDLQITKLRELEASKDNYKPLWRGSSVLNLAEGWDERPRSRSAGSVQQGHRWSSLSLQQVNVLKNQLSDIYGSMKNVQAVRSTTSKPADYEVNVASVPAKPQTKEALHVRRNSLLTRDQLYSPVVKRKEAKRSASLKADSVSAFPTCPPSTSGLSESEKKRLSMSLSQEILDRVKNTKKTSSLPIKKPSVTKSSSAVVRKSAIPIAKPKQSDKKTEQTKIEQSTIVTKSKVNDTAAETRSKKEEQSSKVVKKATEPIEMRKDAVAIKKTPPSVSPTLSDLSPRTCYSLDASDASSMTSQPGKSDFLLVLAPSSTHQSRRDMRRAVEEWAAGKSVTTTARPASETESASSETSSKTVIYREPLRIRSASQSCSNLKELFGERARPPLPATPRSKSRQLRPRSVSPDIKLRACAPGEVRKLTEKFERCRSDPDLTIQTHLSKRRLSSRTPSPIPAKPRRLRPEDRFVSRVNVISKMAALQRRSSALCGDKGLERLLQRERLAREMARRRRCLSGDVERIRREFEQRDSLSLLGQMFTSTPDIRELTSVAPMYFKNQLPSSSNQKRTSSSPDLVHKSSSPSVIKSGVFENQPFDPEIHRAKYTYRPPPPSHQLQQHERSSRSVTFQGWPRTLVHSLHSPALRTDHAQFPSYLAVLDLPHDKLSRY